MLLAATLVRTAAAGPRFDGFGMAFGATATVSPEPGWDGHPATATWMGSPFTEASVTYRWGPVDAQVGTWSAPLAGYEWFASDSYEGELPLVVGELSTHLVLGHLRMGPVVTYGAGLLGLGAWWGVGADAVIDVATLGVCTVGVGLRGETRETPESWPVDGTVAVRFRCLGGEDP